MTVFLATVSFHTVALRFQESAREVLASKRNDA